MGKSLVSCFFWDTVYNLQQDDKKLRRQLSVACQKWTCSSEATHATATKYRWLYRVWHPVLHQCTNVWLYDLVGPSLPYALWHNRSFLPVCFPSWPRLWNQLQASLHQTRTNLSSSDSPGPLSGTSYTSTHHSHHPSPPHSSIPGLKTFVFCKSSPSSLPFPLQDWLHGFPWLFTDISEFIRFLLFTFSFLSHLSCWFRAVD